MAEYLVKLWRNQVQSERRNSDPDAKLLHFQISGPDAVCAAVKFALSTVPEERVGLQLAYVASRTEDVSCLVLVSRWDTLSNL
jgi:hypothetical protein